MLQLLPQRRDNVNGNWNLATDSKFQSMIKNIDDFEIQIRMDRYRIFWILLNQVRVLFFHMIRHLILIMTRMICMKK